MSNSNSAQVRETSPAKMPSPPLTWPSSSSSSGNSQSRWLAATTHIASRLKQEDVLEQLVSDAVHLTGAAYGVIGVLDNSGQTRNLIFSNPHHEDARQIVNHVIKQDIFSLIDAHAPVVIDSLDAHPTFQDYRGPRTFLSTFLAVPVQVREQVFGFLFLGGKKTSFSTQNASNLMVLANAAGMALENATLYQEARARENWLSASRDITTYLLEHTDEEEALELIAALVRKAAHADTALLILPSLANEWKAEIVDGVGAERFLGVSFPPTGRAMAVLRSCTGLIVDNLANQRILRVNALAGYGPALYAPIVVKGEGMGVIVLLRLPGREEFTQNDLTMAESVASQAALALQLAQSRHLDDVMVLHEERDRISRDLHDFAVQQLFATGMKIDRLREDLAQAGADSHTLEVFEQAVTSVDESVMQIRGIISTLREETDNSEAIALAERVRRECSAARSTLNFAPSLLISVDGEQISNPDKNPLSRQIDDRISPELSTDVTAVVRECLSNVARHARAKSVVVEVKVFGYGINGQVQVQVTDDGVGPNPACNRRSGLGNLASRARRHGGLFSLTRGPGEVGTQVTWMVPMAAAGANPLSFPNPLSSIR